jgi:polar amino acid transport system substrate-binding protein
MKLFNTKLLALIGVVALAIGGFIFWSQKSLNPSTSLGITKLVVGTDATYPPLEYANEQGQYVGFDMDLAAEIAKGLGVPLEVKNISFDKIFDSLKNGEVTMVISSVTITEERQKEFLFSAPYLNAGQVIVTTQANNSIAIPEDLAEKKVGVQGDTTSQKEATRLKAVVKVYPDYVPAKADLLTGKIDALIIDYPAAISLAQENEGKLKVVSQPFTNEFYGVVMVKGQEKLAEKVDDILADLKRSGRLSQIENTWFKR